MRGVRRPLAPCSVWQSAPGSLLPKLCAAAVGVSCSARAQPGWSQAEATSCRLRRGDEVTLGMLTKEAAGVRANQSVGIKSNEKAESGMQKAVSGLRLVHVSRNVQVTELREATTGRPVAA